MNVLPLTWSFVGFLHIYIFSLSKTQDHAGGSSEYVDYLLEVYLQKGRMSTIRLSFNDTGFLKSIIHYYLQARNNVPSQRGRFCPC